MEDSGDRFSYYLATALSLSIGWGIRGNFGHEYGAMIPGALAAMAAVLLSRRGDWVREVPFFGMFGALGWSFGGSISYMQVIAYTHSGHSPSVLYGFACLFVIGFLWAALGRGRDRAAGRSRSPEAGGAAVSPGPGLCLLVASGPGRRAVAPGAGIRPGLVRYGLACRAPGLYCRHGAGPAPGGRRPVNLADPPPGRRLVGRVRAAGARVRASHDASPGR